MPVFAKLIDRLCNMQPWDPDFREKYTAKNQNLDLSNDFEKNKYVEKSLFGSEIKKFNPM